MQTQFSEEQLKDRSTQHANEILRSCVHCGLCTATCPTYRLLGDELDSPRGRIYLIKDMLENQRRPDASLVRHIDRCLSCLACMTTCPSGVNYMHLVDHARAYIEKNYSRRWNDRLLRWLLSVILPYPERFRWALRTTRLIYPLRRLIPDVRLRAILDTMPKRLAPTSESPSSQVYPAEGPRRMRVALLTGCVQPVLNADIAAATIRLLTRHGCEVVVAKGAGCCGALTHHMGKTRQTLKFATNNIRAWQRELEGEGLDAIVINTSGCGTTVKDYGHLFEGHPLEKEAKSLSAITRDITEVMEDLRLNAPEEAHQLRVAYHSACSLQHGQQITRLPVELLTWAGFDVVEPRDAHICCGSAGTYSLLQPEISGELKRQKVARIEEKAPQVIATGNIGCMMQIASGTRLPLVHTVELLDWATGGPEPKALGSPSK